MIADNIRHVQKKYIMNFHHFFDRVVYLIIKFIIEVLNYIKTNDEKIIKYFCNIDFDVYYHLAKSQIKIQLVNEEPKITNCIMGKLNQIGKFRM
jgi:hypothetical protein